MDLSAIQNNSLARTHKAGSNDLSFSASRLPNVSVFCVQWWVILLSCFSAFACMQNKPPGTNKRINIITRHNILYYNSNEKIHFVPSTRSFCPSINQRIYYSIAAFAAVRPGEAVFDVNWQFLPIRLRSHDFARTHFYN